MIECWKPVPGYEDLYQISDRGRIRRIAAGFGTYTGRILRPWNDTCGYSQVRLHRNGHGKVRTVHSLVTEAFLGPRPDGLEVNHKNGIKKDNRASNLEYATHSENVQYSFDVLGRKALRGEVHGKAKLTAAAVKQIRRLYAKGGITQCALAEQYGVTYGNIGHILRRKTWAHVA